ncbi:serine protease [Saccharomonospora piscinae]|uniref:Serine protease n=1 Tax=Saccharomonospora piscinae TaxID=687388 RepID=A0A1V9A2M6_SACPI|nr:S8 family serine peptidase [Saccharomonospora piscinae]OQO91194.1 serine protease [Saccharomonospora piscinae]
MRGRRPTLGLVAALATTLAAAPPVAVADADPRARQADFRTSGGPTVTLVTGDRVRLTGSGADARARVEPGAGRENIGFRTVRRSGDVHVVPHDAAPAVAAGTLDRRLFNVSKLIEVGYHDGAREDVPVMVSYEDSTEQEHSRTRVLSDGAAERTGTLAAVDGEALSAAKSSATRFWDGVRPMLRPGQGIEHLWLDAPVHATSDETVPRIGAPEAWENGYTGEGVTVAVLDSGIDADHPDLADAVAESRDFTGEGTVDDEHGHGTHVAGTIAGDGTASDGRYRGVAPDADLAVGRVLNASASGQESWILAGMDWAAERASVVNMSLGATWADDGSGPLAQAVDRLTEETGSLFVVSAGNTGDSTIGDPASADAALTVGAVDNDDRLADFSSRGPRLGDNAVKPEITAPGVDVVAARASGSEVGDPVGDHYQDMSGTSMAAPHVTGAAALVAQARGDADAGELKSALTNSATPGPNATVYEQGAGRVDVARAVRQQVSAQPAVLNLGIQEWPHHDDTPVERALTYTNDGAEPVTLSLETTLHGPEGAPVDGVLSLADDELTVPAGGQAETTVTVDTGVDAPNGLYSGAVLATGGDGTHLRTVLGVTRERESYDVDVTVIGLDGEPVEDAHVRLVSLTEPRDHELSAEDGGYHVRARKGTYYLESLRMAQDATGTPTTGIAVEPRVVVDQRRDIVFDLREGYHPTVELTDRPEARVGDAFLSFGAVAPWGSFGWQVARRDLDDVTVLGSRSEHESFEFAVETSHARPDGDGTFVDSPYLYRLRHAHQGSLPDAMGHRVADDELARVRGSHADSGLAPWGQRDIVAARFPFELAEYYTPGVPWASSLMVVEEPVRDDAPPMLVGEQTAAARAFEPGESVEQRWNTAVQGPAFPPSATPWAYQADYGVGFHLPLYSDGGGHAGMSVTDEALTRLYREGELVGETAWTGGGFEVPNEPASYRLSVHADRGERALLSREIDAEWTFRGGTAGPGQQVALPLLAVHFDTGFGVGDAPEAGEKVRLPFTVQRNGSTAEPELESLRFQVSFDGGHTWRPVPYNAFRDGREIAVTAPEDAKDVSLRVEAKDTDGNGLKQTIVGAYPLR